MSLSLASFIALGPSVSHLFQGLVPCRTCNIGLGSTGGMRFHFPEKMLRATKAGLLHVHQNQYLGAQLQSLVTDL